MQDKTETDKLELNGQRQSHLYRLLTTWVKTKLVLFLSVDQERFFFRAMLGTARRGLCCWICLSVRPSVCLSVCQSCPGSVGLYIYKTAKGIWPLPVLPDNYWQISQNKAYLWCNIFDDMSTISRWSFWSWFDVNRFVFDENMYEKQFLYFCSQWPWPLDLKFPLVNLVRRYVLAKVEVFMTFLFRENRRHGTNGRTDILHGYDT